MSDTLIEQQAPENRDGRLPSAATSLTIALTIAKPQRSGLRSADQLSSEN